MKNGKIIVTRLWARYQGQVPSRSSIISGIDPQKYQTICIYLMKNSEKPNFFEKEGFKVFYLSRKKFLRVFNLWFTWKLSRILKREKVDIVHCHRHQATVYGTVAAKLAGVPVVLSHVHGLNRSKSPRRKFVNSIWLRRVNRILTVGEAVRQDVLKANPNVSPEKVISIGNSIDYNRFANVQINKTETRQRLGLHRDSLVFGTVGRLAPTKGQSCLIKAFEIVKKQLPSAHVLFVGEGRSRKQLEAQAAQTNCRDAIHFLGRRTDVPELLKAMDVFVLPSIAEGLPRSLLEAMAAGVPCIASETGGIPEIINTSDVGFLVPTGNESALAEAIMKLAKMSEVERANLCEKAKRHVHNFYTHEMITEKVQKLYEDIYAEG